MKTAKLHTLLALQDYNGVGILIAIFDSYQQWISKKHTILRNIKKHNTLIYIDAEGLTCITDYDFADAQYPIKVFRPVSVNE